MSEQEETQIASALGNATTQIAERRNSEPVQDDKPRRHKVWEQLVSRLGKRYHKCRLSNFDAETQDQKRAVNILTTYCTKMKAMIELGRGVCLFGPPGTGKDHLLAALMRVAIRDVGADVLWVNGMDLFGRVRDSMDTSEKEKDIIGVFTKPDVLAISDPLPPSGVLTEFQAAFLLRIVDRRYRDCKPTWVTLNVANGKEAEDRMGVQVIDRLRDGAVAVQCNWESYRKANP